MPDIKALGSPRAERCSTVGRAATRTVVLRARTGPRLHDLPRHGVRHRARTIARRTIATVHRPVAKRGSGTKLGSKRFDAIAARLAEGRERFQFSLAIYYGVHRPPEKDGQRFQDIELICRDETKFEARMYGCWREFPEIAKAFLR